MIGSFWNLCRACPSMPVDKLHSEYRSTYRWHEYTGPRQEVVRRAPQGGHTNAAHSDEKRHDFGNATRMDEESHELPKLEPALPRRKKHPDLAYRHHEFIVSDRNNFHDSTDNHADRARSEERGVSRWRHSRRSKSEGPARSNALTNGERRRDSDPDLEDTGRDSGLLKKAISKISTEYRLQFAWPQGHTSRRDAAGADNAPRKSQSMGALKPAANAMIHRKRTEFEPRDGTASELEPLVNESNVIKEEVNADNEYKKPYHAGEKRHFKKPIDQIDEAAKHLLQNGTNGIANGGTEWYKEVVELRKKAGEYRNRGWGSKVVPEKVTDIYNKQVELWDEVSRRSSLSALSLASTAHRSYTKDEKDEENAKKSSPTKALRNAENSKMIKDLMRHHLERTTGGTEFDGFILSPTREKLEPTIPKKDDDSRGSQKNSPKKNSPQKTALQKKNSLKSKSALRTARSQSVGHTDMSSSEKRSPKRQSRSATAKDKKTPTPAVTTIVVTNNVPVTKRPRPSSLNTTASSRSKSSSVPSKYEEERLVKKSIKNNNYESNMHSSKEQRKGYSATEPSRTERNPPTVSEPEPMDLEPVVKSPPEPTRVKSPEQIIMRSPDPVNWTVPLDTGKTFTVTQNVREGDVASRPHSEVQKAWTPPEIPPPIAQSAPPQLTEQSKDQAREQLDTPNLDSSSTSSVISIKDAAVAGKPVVGYTNRCLEETDMLLDTDNDTAITSPQSKSMSCPYRFPEAAIVTQNDAPVTSAKSLAADVLEKARNRFDSFWRKNSQDEQV